MLLKIKYPKISDRENALCEVLAEVYKKSPTEWVSSRELATWANSMILSPILFKDPTSETFGENLNPYQDCETYSVSDDMSEGDFKQKTGNVISREIKEANDSQSLPFIIISNRRKGYKIANRGEADKYIYLTIQEVKRKSDFIQSVQRRAARSDGLAGSVFPEEGASL